MSDCGPEVLLLCADVAADVLVSHAKGCVTCRLSRDLFFLRWSTAMPMVRAVLGAIAASCKQQATRSMLLVTCTTKAAAEAALLSDRK